MLFRSLGWLGEQLADLDALLAAAGFPPETAGPDDADRLRDVAPEIVDVARRLLDQVRAGQLGTAPNDPAPHDPAPNDEAPHDQAPHDPAPHDPAPAGEPAVIRAGWL